jgi:tubulin polyglutamylase TTLL5
VTERRYRIDHTIEAETATVHQVLGDAGWAETSCDDWSLLWSNHIPPAAVYRRLRPEQRVNHVPGIDLMVLKDSLHDHLALHYPGGPDTTRPWTYPRSVPPAHDDEPGPGWVDDPDLSWIAKPRDGSMGRGIRLVNDPGETARDPGLVVQEYVDAPLLFPHHPAKHVLRIYVLVTSVDPVRAFVHRECTVKVTSKPYVSARHDPSDLVVHLTNPTVQLQNTGVADPIRAIDMDEYGRRLASIGADPAELWRRVHQMVGDLMAVFGRPLAVLSSVYTPSPGSCFELLGLDVLVDAQLRPWLLECNMSPSLATRSPAESLSGQAQRRAKHQVVADMFSLIGLGPSGRTGFPGPPGGFEPVLGVAG